MYIHFVDDIYNHLYHIQLSAFIPVFCGDLLTFIFMFTGILLHMAGAAPTPGTLKSFLRRCLALLQGLAEAAARGWPEMTGLSD